ncbi:kmo [Symbiodinium pilosum]|uniref:Kmo protein n=1 Tax=Symbiodinium pilosum TaxID=2952 RepID=A0A812S0Q5_SYMPI|nr:kmo [Symbiodinium pilosum]
MCCVFQAQEGRLLATDDQAAEVQDQMEARRLKLVEGVPILSSSPTVTSGQKRCLAFLRILIFTSAAAGLLWLQIWLCVQFGGMWLEAARPTTGVLGRNGTVVDEEDYSCPLQVEVQDPWAYNLAQSLTSQIAITPAGKFAEGLPVVVWYASEEVYRNVNMYIILSFGARTLNPTNLSLSVEKAMTSNEYMTAIHNAFSRNHLNPLAQRSLDGTMFVSDGKMWVNGEWQDIVVTHDWMVISGLAFGLMLLLCFSVLKWICKEIRHDWKFSCDVWVAQYEYLWERAKRKDIFSSDSHTLSEKEMEEALHKKPPKKEGDELHLTFQERLQMCSPFFVLDNFLSNAYTCEEQAGMAVISSLFHAVVFSAVCLIPCYACCLLPAWAPAFNTMISAYGLCIILLGTFYYASVDHGMVRFSLSLLQIACLAFWTILTIVYIVTAIIYLTAMSAIDEDLIPDALSPLGTVAAYTYIIAIKMKDLQRHYMDVLHGKGSKGFILSQISRLGLTTGAIIMLVLEGVAALVALLILQLKVRNTYAGPGMQGNLLSSAILPTYAVVNSIVQLRKSSMSDAVDTVDDITGGIIEVL